MSVTKELIHPGEGQTHTPTQRGNNTPAGFRYCYAAAMQVGKLGPVSRDLT
jgi:hypothetical protein